MSFNYPKTPQVEQTDYYHGVAVPDPYRWLEDPDSEETKAWIEAQNQVTFSFLEQIPERETIKERLTKLWDYEKYGIPIKKGERYFYFKNDGLQNQSVLYTLNELEEEPRVLLDPNQFSEDGTIALSGIAISDNGQFLAYGISKSGSDWQEWQVRNVETGDDFSDYLQWIKFSGATWTKDNEGFFYSRYDAPPEGKQLEQANYYQKLYYHR
ncbi:MAG: S9 family peptidase, partial [Cyanobacteria bacterium]|nr:S9 family peptidase [Cyanobacteria bacterium GSL.Bin21]